MTHLPLPALRDGLRARCRRAGRGWGWGGCLACEMVCSMWSRPVGWCRATAMTQHKSQARRIEGVGSASLDPTYPLRAPLPSVSHGCVPRHATIVTPCSCRATGAVAEARGPCTCPLALAEWFALCGATFIGWIILGLRRVIAVARPDLPASRSTIVIPAERVSASAGTQENSARTSLPWVPDISLAAKFRDDIKPRTDTPRTRRSRPRGLCSRPAWRGRHAGSAPRRAADSRPPACAGAPPRRPSPGSRCG
jgi:hypothetical protein